MMGWRTARASGALKGRQDLEIRHLRYFAALAEERNFTRAAERLGMAQPPLSRQIQQLEAELGVRLLDHASRPIVLTEAGRLFYAQARTIIEQMDELRTITRRLGQTERTLVIGFVASTLYGALPEVMRRFRLQRPDVELVPLQLSSIAQLEELKGGRIDVGFGRLRFNDPAIRREILREETLVVALPLGHALIGMPGEVTLERLAAHPLIVYPNAPRPSFADQVLSFFRDRALMPKRTREVGELQVALGLVAAGLGLCLVPASVQRLQRDDVVYRPLDESGITSPIIMSTLIGAERTEADLLLALIDEIYAENGIRRGAQQSGLLSRL